MAEYITREAVIEAVSEVYYETPSINLSAEKFEAAINSIPASDVAPVVRCKGCKHLQCCNFTQFLGADGYCSYGEYKCNTEDIKWQTKR